MTTTPTTTRRPRRADALPRDERSSRRNVGAGLAAVLGSLILVVGVPVALLLLVGNPLPTAGPSRAWLTATIDAPLVIDVLAVLVWIVWVHFVVCFLSEWRAIRKGRMPGHVAFGGGSQLVARRLVAGVLMLSGGLAMAHGLATATTTPVQSGAAVSTTATTVMRDGNPAAAALEASGAVSTPRVDADAQLHATKHYEVVPPAGRHHDTLWDISHRLLGDPLRYKEIYDLNKHRMQPDGRRLTDADLIRPGWQLLLPADAKGPGVRVSPAVPTHLGPATHQSASTAGAGEAGRAALDSQGVSAAATPDTRSTDHRLDWLLLGGGLILAGALRALTAQRGPFGAPDQGAAEVAAAADLRRAEFLDAALRGLMQMRTAHDEAMPEVQFVYVDDEQVVLHVLGEPIAPAAPWTVAEDGRSWSLRAEDLVPPGAGAPAPYPSLVNVATTHGFDVLVDLELAPGLISVGGDVGVARDVATAMALDLTTHSWSDGIDVVMVGFGEHLVDLDTGRARRINDLDSLLREVTTEKAAQSSVLAQLGVEGVLRGRQSGAARGCQPMVVFLSGSPSAEQAQQLARLTGGGRTSFSVVSVGDSPSARWRFVVDASGHFESTALGVSGSARRLDREAQRRLRALLDQAVEQRAAAAQAFENSSPAVIAEAAGSAVRQAAWGVADVASAAVSVRLLGPVGISAPGEIDDARRDLVTELVVMAALHEDGLHPAVLRSSLWPRGVEDDVVEARIGDAQRWLGHDDSGAPLLSADAEGRVRLSAEVPNDYAALVRAASAAGAQNPGTGSEPEIEPLLAALNLGSGEVFSGAGRHYSWLGFVREARQARMLTAAVARRAADLAVAADRIDVAAGALRKGLVMVPTSEALWRTLLRLEAQHRPGQVESTITEMYSVLQGHGVNKHEPETEALVIELVPGRERAKGA